MMELTLVLWPHDVDKRGIVYVSEGAGHAPTIYTLAELTGNYAQFNALR
jgi:hypothetical protein